MKKLKIILLILFAIIITIFMIFLVKNLKSDVGKPTTNRSISEIKYLDKEISDLLNSMNNITLEDNEVLVTKTSTNATDINWEYVKKEIEILYSIMPTITLDLYNQNLSQEEILGFNKELDELSASVREENKQKTLTNLANLYRYLPVYAGKTSGDSEYVNLLNTKLNVFNSYVFVNAENWEEASNYCKKAIESYSNILTNLSNKNNSENTNKTYIILNEMENAINIKDKEIFFIKYKNFLRVIDA